MGWSFRRSRQVGPFRFTLGKRGVGWSIGNGFMRFGVRADGRATSSVGLPGTGLRYQTTPKRLGAAAAGSNVALEDHSVPIDPKTRSNGCLSAFLWIGAFGAVLQLAASGSPLLSAGLAGLIATYYFKYVRSGGANTAAGVAKDAQQSDQSAPASVNAQIKTLVAALPKYVKCPNPACDGFNVITVEKFYDGKLECGTCACNIVLNNGAAINEALQRRRAELLREDEERRQRELNAQDERRRELESKFGADAAKAILARQPFTGATPDVIEAMFGKPESTVSESLKKGIRITWRYHEIGSSGRYSTRIRFTNGLCDQWKVES